MSGRGGGRWWRGGSAGRGWRSSARLEARERALAELVAALAAPLRAGVPPAVAVAAAAPAFSDDAVLGPLVLELSDQAARGVPVAEVWRRQARLQSSPDLSFIGQAWALSELTGAPLADALACGEQVLRARAQGPGAVVGGSRRAPSLDGGPVPPACVRPGRGHA